MGKLNLETTLGQVPNGVDEHPGVVADTAMPADLAGQQMGDAAPVIVADVVAAEYGTLRDRSSLPCYRNPPRFS